MKRSLSCFTLIFISILHAGVEGGETVLLEEKFYSKSLGAEEPLYIILPAGYREDAKMRYPVIYLLHGYNFFSGTSLFKGRLNHHYYIKRLRIREVAGCMMGGGGLKGFKDCLKEKKVYFYWRVVTHLKEFIEREFGGNEGGDPLLRQSILVIPYGGNSLYTDRRDKRPLYPEEDVIISRFPKKVLAKGGTGAYESMIIEDLIPMVDKRFRTVKARRGRAVSGFSMGGFGAVKLALKYPDLFGSVSSVSGTLYLDAVNDISLEYLKKRFPEIIEVFYDPERGDFDREYLKENDPIHLVKGIRKADFPFIYFDAPENDFIAKMMAGFFERALIEREIRSYPGEHIITDNSPGDGFGFHNYLYFRSRMGVVLHFHSRFFGTGNE